MSESSSSHSWSTASLRLPGGERYPARVRSRELRDLYAPEPGASPRTRPVAVSALGTVLGLLGLVLLVGAVPERAAGPGKVQGRRAYPSGAGQREGVDALRPAEGSAGARPIGVRAGSRRDAGTE